MKLENCICGSEAKHFPQSETQSNAIHCLNPDCHVGIEHDGWPDEWVFEDWNDLMKYFRREKAMEKPALDKRNEYKEH